MASTAFQESRQSDAAAVSTVTGFVVALSAAPAPTVQTTLTLSQQRLLTGDCNQPYFVLTQDQADHSNRLVALVGCFNSTRFLGTQIQTRADLPRFPRGWTTDGADERPVRRDGVTPQQLSPSFHHTFPRCPVLFSTTPRSPQWVSRGSKSKLRERHWPTAV